ncbi:Fibronectin type III [Trinorchestia longiramus]|nr:Fibronectin type III [Trinorchestia longiramus]
MVRNTIMNLSGRALVPEPRDTFCPPKHLIVALAVNDVQSHSLLVSWEATNETDVEGFKIAFQETRPDGRLLGLLHTHQLPPDPRSMVIEELLPDTRYLVCVQGLTPPTHTEARWMPHTQEVPLTLSQESNDTKCTRVRTLQAPPERTLLSTRLAVLIGSVSAIALVSLVVLVAVCCRLCQNRREPNKPREPPPPTDFLSNYRHLSIPNSDVTTTNNTNNINNAPTENHNTAC